MSFCDEPNQSKGEVVMHIYRGKYPNKVESVYRNMSTGKYCARTNSGGLFRVEIDHPHHLRSISQLCGLDLDKADANTILGVDGVQVKFTYGLPRGSEGYPLGAWIVLFGSLGQSKKRRAG